MKQIDLGRSGLKASAVALGCMRMANLDEQAADRLVCAAVDSGVTLFDHADIYGGGRSEELFGQALRRHPGLRERIVLQSKCGIGPGRQYDASKEHILEAAEGILRRLGVDSIDILLLHRPDALMEPEEVAEAFETLHRAGKVRHFGVSNQNAGQMALLQAALPHKLLINQLQFGPAHTGMIDEGMNVNIHEDHAVTRDGGVLNHCRLHGVTIQAWSPLMYGMFEGNILSSEKHAALNEALGRVGETHGLTPAATAIAWILRHPANMQAIVGTMSERHLRDMALAGDTTLTRQEWYEIYLAAGNPLP